MVPENINTSAPWKFREGGGSQNENILNQSINQNWNFDRGGVVSKAKNLPWEGHDYFL